MRYGRESESVYMCEYRIGCEIVSVNVWVRDYERVWGFGGIV